MTDQNIIEYRLSGGKANTSKNSSLGGEMSEDPAAVIQSSAILNLFDHVDLPRATAGEFNYLIEYINCKSATEGLPSVKWWLDRDTLSDENEFAWSYDNTVNTFINQNSIFFADGVDDNMSLTNEASLWSATLSKFSFSLWIYPTAGWDATTRIIAVHGSGNQRFNMFLPSSGSGNITFRIVDSGGVSKDATSVGTVTLNKWNFITCVFDNSLGSANVKIYVNGIVGGTTANFTGTILNSDILRFGTDLAGSSYKGYIKQFKWWQSVALTAGDSLNLLAGNDSLVTTPSYNLPMDEGQGSPLDTISGTKVGTLNSGATWDNSLTTIRPSGNKYIYAPFKRYNGTSDFDDIADTAALDLLQFSVGAWFRTSKDYTSARGFIVNKGGDGSDTAGENLNYGIYINTTNKLEGGFEEGAGTDHFIASTTNFNDGKWHYALLTYDQVTLRLYCDGKELTNVATTTTPETNAKPLTIGKNSRAADKYFQGDIDEVRVWNNDLTAREQADLYTFGTIPQTANIVYSNKFGNDNGSRIAQTIASITTEPLLASWNNASSEPASPNFYQTDIQPAGSNNLFDSYFPMLIRRRILANSNSSMDNQGIFKLKGLLRRSNTDQGGGEGGSTPPGNVANVNFAVTGDSDCNSTFDKLKAVSVTNGMDHFLITGDVTYDGPTCMANKFTDQSTLIVVNGNHDGGSKISYWRSFMGVQQNYYRKDIQNICIIGMDSEQSFSSGSAQYTFISTELKKASEDNNIDWIIVMIHRPFLSASSTHPQNEGNKTDIYFPLFQQYKVNLVLQSHNHNIQRSKLLNDNPSNHTSPTVVTSGSVFVKGNGFVVMNNGTGGHDTGSALYSLGSQPSWSEYQNDTTNAITMLKWSGTNNSLLTAETRDLNNEIIDSFTMS